jgi:hypothetical protein
MKTKVKTKPKASKEVKPGEAGAHVKVPLNGKELLKMHLAKVMMDKMMKGK